MRKTIILAFATSIFAFATLVTDLVRTSASSDAVVTRPAAQVQATAVPTIRHFDAI